jgi:hypothetical protein
VAPPGGRPPALRSRGLFLPGAAGAHPGDRRPGRDHPGQLADGPLAAAYLGGRLCCRRLDDRRHGRYADVHGRCGHFPGFSRGNRAPEIDPRAVSSRTGQSPGRSCGRRPPRHRDAWRARGFASARARRRIRVHCPQPRDGYRPAVCRRAQLPCCPAGRAYARLGQRHPRSRPGMFGFLETASTAGMAAGALAAASWRFVSAGHSLCWAD